LVLRGWDFSGHKWEYPTILKRPVGVIVEKQVVFTRAVVVIEKQVVMFLLRDLSSLHICVHAQVQARRNHQLKS
jgi:hypothetical protein